MGAMRLFRYVPLTSALPASLHKKGTRFLMGCSSVWAGLPAPGR